MCDISDIITGKLLPLVEEFFSLQGEGFYAGNAAYFLRIGGCDIGCNFCDVKESWDKDKHPLTPVDEMVKRILKAKAKTVVVTGGEPCTYNMNYLCRCLEKHKINRHLETSGSQSYSGRWNWISFSPKKNTYIHPEFYNLAHELKVIIETRDDLFWAEQLAANVSDDYCLYLQPEWSQVNVITPFIVEYILKNPKWALSLQTHKYINIP
jgi:organic radical activating enzyme